MPHSKQSKALERGLVRLKGQTAEVPSRISGSDLRRALAVPEDRMMIVRPASGGLVKQVRDSQSIQVEDGDEFDDVPVGRWGNGAR